MIGLAERPRFLFASGYLCFAIPPLCPQSVATSEHIEVQLYRAPFFNLSATITMVELQPYAVKRLDERCPQSTKPPRVCVPKWPKHGRLSNVCSRAVKRRWSDIDDLCDEKLALPQPSAKPGQLSNGTRQKLA
jgi:hypothetical protein